MKKLTRIEGPWSEKDYKEPKILLRGVMHMKVMHMKVMHMKVIHMKVIHMKRFI
jgi:hypothetical protein